MPNELEDYLRHRARTESDVQRCTVESELPNGHVLVRTIGRKSLLEVGKPFPTDSYTRGQRVDVELPAASGNVIGGMGVITSRSPQKGLSATTPSEVTDAVSKARIVSIDPDPLVLHEDGEERTQVIFGVGLTSAGAYVSAVEDGDDPDIESVDDEVTATKVTRVIKATFGTARGWFDFLCDGIRRRKALRILPRRMPETLYVLSYSQTLYVLDPRTLEVLDSYAAGTDSVAIDRIGTRVVVCGDPLFIVDPRDGSTDTVPVPWGATPPYFALRYGGPLWYRATGSGFGATTNLLAMGLIGGTQSQVSAYPISGATPGGDVGMVAANGIIWAPDENDRLIRFDTATLTASFVAMPERLFFACAHANTLYVTAIDTATVYRRDLATGAPLGSIVLPSTDLSGGTYLASAGGKLFAAVPRTVTGDRTVDFYRVLDNLSSATLITTESPFGPGQFVGGESAVFMADYENGTVLRINASDFAVTTSAVIDAAGLDTAFMYYV